ncbi:MAG TPA: hypothetical protein VHC91_24720 [Trinickia sp.]|uniref:hypothetical protein n=1 Tax=Trinickia sp. TaxID=2571163 RepID=UPI002B9D6D1E|nr:hypothetical protein [Trinickia sp.]HVW53572.1 hypothetical protein [Trinickia sp.]
MGGAKRDTAGHDTVSLQAIVTTQAAYYYADGISLKPCNWVKVHGAPGHTMICNVTVGGEIIGSSDPNDGSQLPGILMAGEGTSYGTGPYRPMLNADGFTWFLIRGTRSKSTLASASNLLLISGSVADQDDPDHPVSLSPSFQDYWDANPQNDPNQHFVGYAYTSGAPSDGVTPCCVQVKADSSDWGVVRVAVTSGHATIVDASSEHPQWRDVKLQSDGCATILLVGKTEESVQFTMTLPNAPGTYQLGPFAVRFQAFPTSTAPAQRDGNLA